MAKSVKAKATATKKTGNRRMKRTVRRTIGALCMISAITVAAIPVPDLEAYNATYNGSGSVPTYADLKAANKIKNLSETLLPNSNRTFTANGKAFNIAQNSQNSWQMDWQFHYYAETAGANGFITKYNDQYQVNEVSLKNRVYSDYLNIPEAQVKDYYNSKNETVSVTVYYGDTAQTPATVNSLGFEHVLTGEYTATPYLDGSGNTAYTYTFTYKDNGNTNISFFTENFGTDLNNFKSQYEAWARYQTEHTDPYVAQPDPLRKTYGNKYASDEDRQQYLCNQLFGEGTPMKLQTVDKRTYKADGVTPDVFTKVYVPRLYDPPSTGSDTLTINGVVYYADANLFLSRTFASIIGIGKEAFKDVKNVKTLVMDKEVKYIGNSAFENSFVEDITLSAEAAIGNRAFAQCGRLKTVNIPTGVTAIGAEAFENTIVESIVIPDSVTIVGDGAFNNCVYLKDVEFESGSTQKSVGNAAFFDCLALNRVEFNDSRITGGINYGTNDGTKALGLGDACFAVSMAETGQLTEFDMPDYLSSGDQIGEYLLGKRLNLKKIIMPTNLSGTSTGNKDIEATFVAGCLNLECVEFPDNAYNASFDKSIFYDVTNDNFYVKGPKLNGYGSEADPRKSTWTALFDYDPATHVGTPVPYVYEENGHTYYEVAKDVNNDDQADYLMSIREDGTLESCEFVNSPTELGTEADPFRIPATVGTLSVSGLGQGCFGTGGAATPNDLVNWIKYLKIDDGSAITTLEDGVFANAKRLENIDIGDSVTSIGNSTFESCPVLEAVTIGENIQSIGDKAFKGCTHVEDIYFDNPGDLTKLQSIGTEALSTGGSKLTVHGEIDPQYMPFAWSMAADNYVNPDGCRVCYKQTRKVTTKEEGETNATEKDIDLLTVIVDNTNLMPTLVDYLHYEDVPKSIRDKAEGGSALTNVEQEMYNAASEIVLPEGIKSIDVAGFISRGVGESDPVTGTNATGKTNGLSYEAYIKDFTRPVSGKNYSTQYRDYGLFNGYYGTYTGDPSLITPYPGNSMAYEYEDGNRRYETNPVGNDRITSIRMNDVVYLPDKAFNSCEKLQMIALGDDMQDVGSQPILGCTALTSIGSGTNKYEANNGILYENTTDGKKIIEAFPGRGSTVGAATVNSNNDPDLTEVTEIAPGAFENCDDVRFVTLDGIKATVIPEDCFKDCDNLRTVDIPAVVRRIEKNAFDDIDIDTEVIARNRDVVLSTEAFGDFAAIDTQPYYTTYKDAPSRIYAREAGVNVDQTLDDVFTVTYYSYDGIDVLKIDKVTDGGISIPPDDEDIPIRDGYTFVGWNRSLKNITSDCFVLALYEPNSNTSPGVSGGVVDPTSAAATSAASATNAANGTPQTTNGSGSSSTKYPLTVVYGSGSGQYPEGTKVIIEAIDAPEGKVFDKWVVTGAAASVYSSTSKATTVTTAAGETIITATYKNAGSNTGGSGSGSGGSGTKTSTGTHNRTGADGSPAAGTGSSTRVDITKPGISDVDKAYASVSGSTDSFVVKITESSDAANAVATALANKYGDMTPIKYFAMDISLYDATGTNKITDTTGLKVNVTMPIPDALRQYAGNNKVGAVVNGTVLEDLACKFTTVDGIPCISFTATHFSPYTIYVDTNNLQVGLMDSSPKTGDPIHPKWFVTIALAATSLFLFLKRDKVAIPVKA